MIRSLFTLACLLFTFIGLAQTKNAEIANTKSPSTVQVTAKGITTKTEEFIPEHIKTEANTAIFVRQSINKIFERQLKNDGILKPTDKKLKLNLTNDAMIVNGKLMSQTLTTKYVDIYLSLMRKDHCVGCPVTYEMDTEVTND